MKSPSRVAVARLDWVIRKEYKVSIPLINFTLVIFSHFKPWSL